MTYTVDGELVALIIVLLIVAAGMAVNIAYGPGPTESEPTEEPLEGETP